MSSSTPPPGQAASPDALLAQLRTELAAARHEQAQLARQLEAVQAELGDFAYTVSHDLRASLRHITAYVDLVREDLGGAMEAGVSSHLNVVANAARLMGRQMDGLMALSRLDRSELNMAPVDVRPLIAQARSAFAAEMADRQMEWQVADDFPLVRGDAALVRQIWSVLLSNALKYTRSRAVARVQIGWTPHEGPDAAASCTFFIRDNGVGFNPQFAGKLFHVFQRLHSSSEFEGIGMGLALMRKIVERHGGRVWAQGEADAGCCISFTLPLANPAPPSAGMAPRT